MDYTDFLHAWHRLGVVFNFPPFESKAVPLLKDETGDRLVSFLFQLPLESLEHDYPLPVNLTLSVLQEMAFELSEEFSEQELFQAIRSQLQAYRRIGAFFTAEECRTLISSFRKREIPDLVPTDLWTGLALVIMAGYILLEDFDFNSLAHPLFEEFLRAFQARDLATKD